MRKLLFALFLVPAIALANQPVINMTVTQTGINGEDMADSPVTDSVNLMGAYPTDNICWTAIVTAGSSTRLVVSCEDTGDNGSGTAIAADWAVMSVCDNTVPNAVCKPDKREWTLADGLKIKTCWNYRSAHIRCTFDDPDDGTGTVVVTGQRGHN